MKFQILPENKNEIRQIQNDLRESVASLRKALKAQDRNRVLEKAKKLSRQMADLGYANLKDQARLLQSQLGVKAVQIYQEALTWI